MAAVAVFLSLLLMAFGALASPAYAAFPGANGKIVYHTFTNGTGYQVETIQPDGSGHALLFPGDDAAWSADGQRIAFTRGNDIYTARPNGLDLVQVTNRYCDQFSCQQSHGANWSPDGRRLALWTWYVGGHSFTPIMSTINADGSGENDIAGNAFDPAWSPDGNTIAFHDGSGIATMPPGGSAPNPVSGSSGDSHPSWSPDGSHIAFVRRVSGFGAEIWVMNSDGTNQTRLTFNPGEDLDPAWSPDGSKLVFERRENSQADLFTIKANGVGETNVTTSPSVSEQAPDWQPLPPTANGYARPRAATPVTVRFAPAFNQCLGSNPPGSTHGAPFAVPSCAPPRQSSLFLTMGTGDSNGEASQFLGSLQIKTFCNPPAPNPAPPCAAAGDQADVKLDATFTDVRTVPDLTDYLGELEVRLALRMTDRHNGTFGNEPATVTDVPFRFAVPCSGDLDTTVGSTCAVSTTAEAVVPGIAPEGKRSVWQLGQVQVYDGGADGQAASPDNTLFATQGLFIP